MLKPWAFKRNKLFIHWLNEGGKCIRSNQAVRVSKGMVQSIVAVVSLFVVGFGFIVVVDDNDGDDDDDEDKLIIMIIMIMIICLLLLILMLISDNNNIKTSTSISSTKEIPGQMKPSSCSYLLFFAVSSVFLHHWRPVLSSPAAVSALPTPHSTISIKNFLEARNFQPQWACQKQLNARRIIPRLTAACSGCRPPWRGFKTARRLRLS